MTGNSTDWYLPVDSFSSAYCHTSETAISHYSIPKVSFARFYRLYLTSFSWPPLFVRAVTVPHVMSPSAHRDANEHMYLAR